MSDSALATLVVGLVPLALALVAGLGARKANARAAELERGKADTAMIQTVQEGYRTLLKSLEDRIAALEADLERLRRLLNEERTANDALHAQMRTLQAQAAEARRHRQIILALYRQLRTAGLTPVVELDEEYLGGS